MSHIRVCVLIVMSTLARAGTIELLNDASLWVSVKKLHTNEPFHAVSKKNRLLVYADDTPGNFAQLEVKIGTQHGCHATYHVIQHSASKTESIVLRASDIALLQAGPLFFIKQIN